MLCSVGIFSFLVKSLALFLDDSSNPAVIQGSLFDYIYIVVPAYWFINHSLNWKFRVRTGNFDFFKLEISTFQLEISSSNWKFRLLQTGNFDIPTGNFEFELEISTLSNWKFRV